MATWQERMEQKARESMFYAQLAGACGACTDEGDDHRSTVFEYSRLDALAVARTGYLGKFAKAYANSKDIKKQLAVADFLANPGAARAAGVVVITDVKERQLGKAEFFARRDSGVQQLLAIGRFSTTRDAEIEWMKQEAETKSGFRRDDPNPTRRKAWQRAFNALRAHDFR